MVLKRLELKIPPVVLLVLAAILIVTTSRWSPTYDAHKQLRATLSILMLILALSIAGAGVFEFRKKSTTVDPRKPQKASALVTSGVYRITRNPMYVGFLLALFSLTIYMGSFISLIYCVVFYAYMNSLQITPEERFLKGIFGREFEVYCQRVRRWL